MFLHTGMKSFQDPNMVVKHGRNMHDFVLRGISSIGRARALHA